MNQSIEYAELYPSLPIKAPTLNFVVNGYIKLINLGLGLKVIHYI